MALAGGCARCPDGEIPLRARVTLCDERTRMCTTEERLVCPCDEAGCPDQRAGCDPISGVGEWLAQDPLPNVHVVDGAFTGDEWEGATVLEGLFTDVYMDYRDGRLYFLNDWRANDEGIRPSCFNYFQIRIGEDWIDLRVYGDGRVEVTRNDAPVSIAADGAYGFGPSPTQPAPHTIYEFSLAVEPTQIDICCFDPLTESQCDALAHEPMVVSLRTGPGGVQVRRGVVPGSVARLGADDACGGGQGICADGLRCVDGRCEGPLTPPPRPPDAGAPDAGPPTPPD